MVLKRMRQFLGRLGAHEALLEASRYVVRDANPTVVQIRLHGSKLLVLANEDVGRRMLVFRRYEERDVRALLRLIRPADICFDVGSNTGFYTMLMAKAASKGQVHAFEPLPLNLHLLSCGILLNELDNITVQQCALGAEDGNADFSESSDGAYSSLFAVGRKPERSKRKVRVRSIDSYVVEQGLRGPDVIKIDVEGAEGLVLDGARRVLDDPASRPRVILIELIDENLAPYGESVQRLVGRLEAAGYTAFVASNDEGPLQAYAADGVERYENVFFLSERADAH